MKDLENIDERISELSFLDKMLFRIILTESLSDKRWCESQGLDSSSPDTKKAKEILYKKLGLDEPSSRQNILYSPNPISSLPY